MTRYSLAIQKGIKKTVNHKIYCFVEQVARIELARPGRKHGILPLNYTCTSFMSIALFSLESQVLFHFLKLHFSPFYGKMIML